VKPGVKNNLTYLHLYTDTAGETHFAESEFEFKHLKHVENRESITAHEITGVQRAILYKLAQGAVEDWHVAPRKQWGCVIQGMADITASDGEVRRLRPGSIILIDDTTGKGHITTHVGEEDHITMMIPVEGNL
jgi:quercetin dioxygenase-like cupin family protein